MTNLNKYGNLSFRDFRKIIRKAGYKTADLNRFLKRSHSYLHSSGHRKGIVKPKHIIDLCDMIGDELFIYCHEEVMKENKEALAKREKRLRATEYHNC